MDLHREVDVPTSVIDASIPDHLETVTSDRMSLSPDISVWVPGPVLWPSVSADHIHCHPGYGVPTGDLSRVDVLPIPGTDGTGPQSRADLHIHRSIPTVQDWC